MKTQRTLTTGFLVVALVIYKFIVSGIYDLSVHGHYYLADYTLDTIGITVVFVVIQAIISQFKQQLKHD